MIDYVVYYGHYRTEVTDDGAVAAVIQKLGCSTRSCWSIPIAFHCDETLEIDVATTIIANCPPGNLLIFTKSEQLVEGITELPIWKRMRWREQNGAPIENAEAWKALDYVLQHRGGKVQWHWIPNLYDGLLHHEAGLDARECAVQQERYYLGI